MDDRWMLIMTFLVTMIETQLKVMQAKKEEKNEDLVMFLNSPGSHFQEQLNQGTQVISSGLSPSYPISELWFSLC